MPFDLASLYEYLPLMTGFAATAAVGLAASLWGRQRSRRRKLAPPPTLPTGLDDDWQPGETAAADRRTSVRREGAPVKVFLSCPARPDIQDAWVMDRSTGGLRVAVPAPLPAESFVQVRAANAPDTVPWVGLVVRSCKPVGEHFELGCAFEQTPPWNVLLLFG